MRSRGAKACLVRAGSSSSIRGRTPGARRRISSSSASPRASNTSTGTTQTRRSTPNASTRCSNRVAAYLSEREVYSLDCYVGADERYRVPLRVYTELAWHNLFAHHLFITPERPVADFAPEFTVVDAALFEADPERDGTRTGTFILVNFARRIILIGGTRYAGEIKKSVFTVMNYLLPLRETLPMHCSANVGAAATSRFFFGLSGTGKTTLSSDPHRPLIGDDEHGWSADGVFNFEGGCYAKVIRLSPTAEPEIWAATNRFSTVLENVVYDEATRTLDVDSDAKTENTRSAYPLEFIPNIVPGSRGRSSQDDHHADGRRVRRAAADLEALARTGDVPFSLGLHREGRRNRARHQRAAGDVLDLLRRAVHGASPDRLRATARRKIEEHDVECWLVNTGWTGGPYGVGHRMSIAHTRAMVNAAIEGRIPNDYEAEPLLRLDDPQARPRTYRARSSIRATPGPTRPPTTSKRASSRSSSSITSSASKCT